MANEIRPNQYFGVTLSEEEEEELARLEGEELSTRLKLYRARTRALFPSLDQRMQGTGEEIFRAIEAGRRSQD